MIELPYNFYPETRPFQAQIWNAPQKNKILVIPRRHGKTSLALNWLICEAIQNPNKVYWYIAPTQKQAKEIVWKAPEMIGKYLPMEAVDKKNEVELTIYLKNGAQIHVKGADNPDSLRGTNPFGVIIDEYAQIKPELYDEILMPILKANGGWVWLMGTPKGKNDFYLKYEKFKNDSEWFVLRLRASEAKVLPPDVLLEAQKSMTQTAYSQEFETEFLDGAGAVFRRVRQNAAVLPEEPQSGVDYFVGVDLARHVDWTVIKVFRTDTWQEVYHDRFNQIDYNLQKAKIEAVIRRYNNASARIDATGVGDPIVEDLRMQGLAIEGFVFTNSSKAQIVQNLVLLLESDQIKILPDEQTVKELEAFSYEIGATGNVRYSAPDGQHDDCVMALALATYKLPPKTPKSYEGVEFLNRVIEPKYNEYGEPSY